MLARVAKLSTLDLPFVLFHGYFTFKHLLVCFFFLSMINSADEAFLICMYVCMNDMNTVVLKFLPMPEGLQVQAVTAAQAEPEAAPLKAVAFCSLQFNKRLLLFL